MKTTPPRRATRHRADSILVWFDLEFTSLDFDRAHLLQAAMTLTDRALRRIGPPEDDVRAAVRLPPRARIGPWVRKTMAPLIRLCRSAEAIPVAELDRRLSAALDRRVGPPAREIEKRPVLAGNSLHADWAVARRLLPEFSRRLHYRHLDVTAFKLHGDWIPDGPEFKKDDPATIRRWFPEAVLPPDSAEHDAGFDVQASIAELAFYRAHLFKNP